MNISIDNHLQENANNILIPLFKNNHLDEKLEEAAALTGVNVDLLKQDFGADFCAVHTIYGGEGANVKRVYLLGLGDKTKFKDCLFAFRSFGFSLKKHFPTDLGIDFLKLECLDEETIHYIEAAINGLVLSHYDAGLYKSDKKSEHPLLSDMSVRIATPEHLYNETATAIEKGLFIGETQLEIFDLVNATSNYKTAEYLGNWALKSGKRFGYKVTVMNKAEIENLGLHALLAVNRGSELPPRFIVMEYKPADTGDYLPKIGLVGKGITYDTGGLSIKTSAMEFMKSDMGGAAAVMGTLEAVAKLEMQAHVIGIVPATDNAVDALSIRPGDVINSYSGKTIEVMNTDAEGRLVLADGLAYMCKHFSPDVIVDLATLTGSSVRTLGNVAAALFTKNDDLADILYDAGQTTGERVWRLPMWDDYKQGIQSDIADVRNIAEIPVADATYAAKFLETFTDGHAAWAHLDIAPVAFGKSKFGKDRLSTAFGIRLLVEFIEGM